MANLKFTYKFTFSDGRKHEHIVELDDVTGRLVATPKLEHHQPWTALEFNKCEHCPLNAKDSPQCPLAVNLAEVARDFKNEKSYSKVTIEVHTEERVYSRDLPLQDGLFGLYGLIMATSDCPYFAFLRPMARFHLPFSSLDETMVRSTSFYLFKQYFIAQKGGKPDFELKEFANLYENLRRVNMGIIDRIRSIAKGDADANSILILDAFASLLANQAQSQFTDLEKFFS